MWLRLNRSRRVWVSRVRQLADDAHRLEAGALRHVPVDERVADRAVELLVAHVLGTHQGEVGLPRRHRGEHRRRRREVAPGDADGSLGRGLQAAGAAEEGDAVGVVTAVGADDQRHRLLLAGELGQQELGRGVVGPGQHRVLGAVPHPQLALQGGAAGGVRARHHQDWAVGHVSSLSSVLGPRTVTVGRPRAPGNRLSGPRCGTGRPGVRSARTATVRGCPTSCPA